MPQHTDTFIPLSLIAEAEAEERARLRDAQIAAYFGFAASRITAMRHKNPVYWDHLERRWMSETFGPLAPMHLLAVQARDDRALLRDQARAARRRDFCLHGLSAPPQECEPASTGWWSRAGVAVMDWLARHVALQNAVMTWAMLGLAAYFALTQVCPGWTQSLLAGIVDFLKGY